MNDVYMHADLQRKLIRLLKGKYKQIFIATHSIEIMSEVEPENILPIDSSLQKLEYANKTPMVQQIIENIGSVHNLEIVRIFSHKKFLIVEGDSDDTKLLGIFHDTLFKNSNEPIDTIPKTFVEGWGGWQRVIGSNKVFKDTNLNIKTYCILDSDYHINEDKNKRYDEAFKHEINLHIWERKEIENYLLIPSLIHRVVIHENPDAKITIAAVEKMFEKIAEDLKETVTDNYATEISDKDKSLAAKTVNTASRELVNNLWDEKKLWIVPGKKFIKTLSSWTQTNYHVSLNPFKVCRLIKIDEIHPEIKELLNKLEKNEEFTPPNSKYKK